ncbi:hypothetical protein TOT_020000921 [Theileria orientalis strain Shintoku]|uniref:Uncharacterized protein n=1 Tax=Theileria orientalis strain Shintoku TaxID=869250 RepID=J4CD78_THEOR|nr:hypothetical protein TOT_020000921 [Theileria orientalis strain Shintoku]PVC49914.1 hypothetical protein MACL_00002672 [Theileria orientalis]BAM40667.1 hypothetical protein TOT_020000921 [Theileria orientalis strain Shintoku]|eukprot:XP_009690968.1 hypothetical protein TOT_020000921 [Theileria orientalis strain Shintoku]
MKVLTVIAILYSYHVCKCINSDDEDEVKAQTERIILGMTDDELDEHMRNLRLGARPKNRSPLTNQFPIDFSRYKERDSANEAEQLVKEIEQVVEKEKESIEEEEEDIREKERVLRERERELLREERRLEEEARKLQEAEEELCERSKLRKLKTTEESKGEKELVYGYEPFDPNVKHYSPGLMYRPVDPKMLEKPPSAVNYKSFIHIPESDKLQDLFPEIPPPPPTSFPRPCQCSCGPRSRNQHQNDANEGQQEQGAEGGAPQQQPAHPQQPRQNQRRDDSNLEGHREFPPFGPGHLPPLPVGAVPVLPPPPPRPPFQNLRPPVPSPDEPKVKKPAMYDDITPEKVSVCVEIKKGRCALKSNFHQRYGRNGRLCHIFTPLQHHYYNEVKYKDQTIWKSTNDRQCTRVELCNIGLPEKIVYLDFNRGNSEKYKKTNNKWYKI